MKRLLPNPLLALTAMIAFASNSLLCRMALKHTDIDPISFTSVRIVSGAGTLWILMRLRGRSNVEGGSWLSALSLIFYAVCFACAYKHLSTGTGALLLFGAAQATMAGYGIYTGERVGRRQALGLGIAFIGLFLVLLPGMSPPRLPHFFMMIGAGVAWGFYSMLGKNSEDPGGATAGNFLRAAPLALILNIVASPGAMPDLNGMYYATLSGALASGVGYVIWYAALRGLKATSAGALQLSVPIIASLGGVIFLNEAFTLHFLIYSGFVLGGIALVIRDQ